MSRLEIEFPPQMQVFMSLNKNPRRSKSAISDRLICNETEVCSDQRRPKRRQGRTKVYLTPNAKRFRSMIVLIQRKVVLYTLSYLDDVSVEFCFVLLVNLLR